MARLIFDIETSALPPEHFDDVQREYLFREADKLADNTAREARRADILQQFNLDVYCKAFGIESPKSHGVTGMDVNRLLAEKRYRNIAEYCLRDVEATLRLFNLWKERLAGIK